MTTDIYGRTNADLKFAYRVTPWAALYPSARYRVQIRDGLTRALLYEWCTHGGPHSPGAVSYIATAGGETLVILKMPAVDAHALGPVIACHDLRVEEAGSDSYLVIESGTLRLSEGVTY